jgi:hypothetical protein
MVLVDTSVWIRFLAGRAPYAAELDRLLGLDEVTGHELVYGELLIGDRGGRRKLLAAYERMHQAAMFLTVRSSRSFAIATCTVVAWAGLTFTFWLPLSSGDCSYGRPTHVSSRSLTSLVSLTRRQPEPGSSDRPPDPRTGRDVHCRQDAENGGLHHTRELTEQRHDDGEDEGRNSQLDADNHRPAHHIAEQTDGQGQRP